MASCASRARRGQNRPYTAGTRPDTTGVSAMVTIAVFSVSA